MTGLRVAFRRDRFHDLTEAYELTIDGEPFTVEVSDGTVDIRPGSAANPTIKLRTDAGTLVAVLTGELGSDAALAADRASLEGDRKAFDRFVEAFAFAPATPA